MKHLPARLLTGLVVALALSALTIVPAFANSNCGESNNGVCEQEKPGSTVVLSSNLEDNFDVKALALLSDEESAQLKEKLTGLLGQPELFKQVVNEVRKWLKHRLTEQENFTERLKKKKEVLEWSDEKYEKYKSQFERKFEKKKDVQLDSIMKKKKFYLLEEQRRSEALEPAKKKKALGVPPAPNTPPVLSFPPVLNARDEVKKVTVLSTVKEVNGDIMLIGKFGSLEKLLVSERTVLVQIDENGVASNIAIEAFQPGDRVFSLANVEKYMPHVGTAVVVVRMLN